MIKLTCALLSVSVFSLLPSLALAQSKPLQTEIITHAFLGDGEVLTFSSDPDTLAKCNGEIAGDLLSQWDRDHIIILDTWDLYQNLEAVQFSGNGRLLATWDLQSVCDYSRDGSIRLLDMDRPEDGSRAEYIGTLGGHNAQVTSVTFSADNKFFAACYERVPNRYSDKITWKPIRIFDVSTLNEVAFFTVPGTATNVQFSPDGQWVGAISTQTDGSEFSLWDFSRRRKTFTTSIPLSHDYRFTTESETVVFAASDVTSPTALKIGQSSPTLQPFNLEKALDLFQPGFTVTSSDSEMILHHRKRNVTITVPVPPESSNPLARRLTRSADGEMALVGSTLIEFKTGKVRTMDSKRGIPSPPPAPLIYPAKPNHM